MSATQRNITEKHRNVMEIYIYTSYMKYILHKRRDGNMPINTETRQQKQ